MSLFLDHSLCQCYGGKLGKVLFSTPWSQNFLDLECLINLIIAFRNRRRVKLVAILEDLSFDKPGVKTKGYQLVKEN